MHLKQVKYLFNKYFWWLFFLFCTQIIILYSDYYLNKLIGQLAFVQISRCKLYSVDKFDKNLTLVLLNPYIPCLCKQCRSRSVGLFRSQLIWIYTVCHSVCELRNRSALAVICWVINHCLEVSCKVDQITSAELEWFIFLQLTDKLWFITQQIMHKSWSISILTHRKRRKCNCIL